MAEVLFYVIIFLANIIQGITGFAGTILAMPFSIHLVGYAVAKPVLNVLGIIAGIYVVAGGYQKVNTEELKRVCLYMGIGIVAGIFLKQAFAGHERLLYVALGIFVIGISTFPVPSKSCGVAVTPVTVIVALYFNLTAVSAAIGKSVSVPSLFFIFGLNAIKFITPL